MASEIRVDTSKNASGLCTVTYSNTGAVLSGITTGTFSGDITGGITGNVTGSMSGGSVSATTGSFSSDVGIGTDDPDASLEIYKGSAGTYLKAGGDNANNGRSLTFTSSATSNSVDGGKHTINATSGHGELALATAGSERMIITSSGAVAIGTDEPTYSGGDMQHEIKKNNNRTYTAPLMVAHSHLLLNNSDTTTNAFCGLGIRAGTGDGAIGFVYNGSANSSDFVISTDGGNNGTERLRIDNSGRLLYGTTSSTRETSLVLVGNSNSYATNPGTLDLFTGNTPSNLGSMGQICFGTQNVVGARIDGRADQDWTVGSARGTHLRFLTCDNNTTTLDERMRITNAGDVGIGTPSPATTLDVQGDMAVAYSATHALRFYTQPRNNWSSISNTATDGNANLSFKTSQGEAMYMTYSKLVGIGTDNPGYKLHVSQTSSAVARFERTGGAWTKVDIKAGSSSGNSYLTFSDTDASEVGAINYEHNDNSLRFETYDGSNKQLRAVLDTSGNFYVADQPSFSITSNNSNSFGDTGSHYTLAYASPIPIFTSGNTTTEHHVGSVLTYHDYVAGSNTGKYVKFTAPVAGNYLFGLNIELSVAANDWVGFGFEINNTGTHNTTLERLVAWTHNQSAEDSTAQARRRSYQSSCLIRLAADDYVVPYQQSSTTSTMSNTFRVWGMLVN